MEEEHTHSINFTIHEKNRSSLAYPALPFWRINSTILKTQKTKNVRSKSNFIGQFS